MCLPLVALSPQDEVIGKALEEWQQPAVHAKHLDARIVTLELRDTCSTAVTLHLGER